MADYIKYQLESTPLTAALWLTTSNSSNRCKASLVTDYLKQQLSTKKTALDSSSSG